MAEPTEHIKQVLKRHEKLKADKSMMLEHWEDLAHVLQPRRMGFTSELSPGERRTDDLYDGTPMQARRGLANSIGGMIRPQGLPEVKIKAERDELNNSEEAQVWLEDAGEKVKKAFDSPKARFRQASGETDDDLVTFGTADMFVGDALSRAGVMFKSLHLKDIAVAFGEDGLPNAHYYERKWPIRQIAERFGENALSENSKKKLKDDQDCKITVLHVVQPRKNGRPDALMARMLPFEDLWIERDEKHQLFLGGFHEFPFVIPRWDTASGEDYGRSPGMIALPDADTLQAMGETILVAGQRSADPPLAVPNDGAFDAINTFPGGLSYYDIETAQAIGGVPFFPIPSGTNLPIARDMQLDTRQQVWAAFFRNVMNLPVEGPQMTATEVIQRKEEFMREMGPIFGRLESDYTAPMVERVFMVLLRQGVFLPIPPSLQGQDIRFEYESPVKRIRQQIEASAAKMWASEMIALSEFKPEAADLIDVDALGRFGAEAMGVPKRIVNSIERVQQIRDARAEATAQQNRMAELQGVADLTERYINMNNAAAGPEPAQP